MFLLMMMLIWLQTLCSIFCLFVRLFVRDVDAINNRTETLNLYNVQTSVKGLDDICARCLSYSMTAVTGPLTLESPEAVIVPHQITWRWYTGRWWVGCCIWYSEEGTGQGPSPPRPLLAVPNVTAHPSTASVPITVLLYNCSLLFSFNVPTKR